MRVSVSRSKNFPRPTSSSNFLSHLASTRETLFFSLPSYSRKVERSSRGHGERGLSRSNRRVHAGFNVLPPSWVNREFKEGSLLVFRGLFPLHPRHDSSHGIRWRESRRSWLERRDFIRTASLLADYSFSFLKARCGLCRPAPVER